MQPRSLVRTKLRPVLRHSGKWAIVSPFCVTEDVNIGDLIVIRRGAEAWAVVTAVRRRDRKGLAGTLDVSIQPQNF